MALQRTSLVGLYFFLACAGTTINTISSTTNKRKNIIDHKIMVELAEYM